MGLQDRGQTASALESYRSLARFYAADPRRVDSRELDVGLWWREDAAGALHRAAWVGETGELYVVRLGPSVEGGGHVEVLATVTERERLERVLDGWRDRCGHPGSLAWLRERAAQAPRERAKRSSPSSGMVSHATADSTNCRYPGRMPGSRSSAPSRTATSSSLSGSPLNNAEPQVAQKSLGLPSGGLKARSSSAPCSRRKPARGTRPLADAAVPVRRWQ
jgi:hypothetical protein